jgi:hypothetical protein
MRESSIKLQHVAALLGPVLLIPAGLAGILAGLQSLDDIEGSLAELLTAAQALTSVALPWCTPIACLLFGLGLIALAAGLLARGLQSALR